MAIALATPTLHAAAPALQGKLGLRPLSPSDIKDYALPSVTQKSSGLLTVPVGGPAYLEATVNSAVPAADIVSVNWTITSKPVGSAAALTDSPLGANVPLYEPSDRVVAQVASRKVLFPDVRGEYVVTAEITTTSSGSTNVSITMNGGTFMGLNTCALCHSGGLIAEDMMTPFTNTAHATKLTRSIDGLTGSFNKNCMSCHTVGYDTATNAVNGGFDDVAKELNWSFPTVVTNGNWAAMPSALKNLGNIQCESCHGPGSEHAFSLGASNKISVSWGSGNCGSCHDAKDHHYRNAEWANSRHALATRSPSGPGREGCVGCHTAGGFATRMAGASPLPTTYSPIGCVACHDPHSAKNPHQLRSVANVTLLDGFTTITNAGNSALCMTCHLSRRNATNYVEVTAGGSTFGPHESPQTDMLMGANAITYGTVIPSSAHREVVKEGCISCHMQPKEHGEEGWLEAGGHTFAVKSETGLELTEGCTECHGTVSTFNFARQDFDGDGTIEGVQTEVQGLLDRLAYLLPPVGTPKSDITINNTWSRQQLRAAYNYRFVQRDGSHGIHNTPYAVGILKASIADLSGDANNDGLPDAWQIQFFGSAGNPSAAPGACVAGDGVPNWLKYSLGLDPMTPGVTVPDGVVWANASTMGGSTNTIQIYNAAEVAFNTEVGKTYQLQSITSMGGTWQNVGSPITGTGTAMSYVTPMRNNVQQYFRVVTQ